MEIVIDKLTPCLEKVKGHSIVDTDFKIATKEDLKSLKKWQFKWTSKDLHECEIYKLTVNGDERIQGLVAIQDIHGSNAVYVKIAESAPHNIGINKEYLGVAIEPGRYHKVLEKDGYLIKANTLYNHEINYHFSVKGE